MRHEIAVMDDGLELDGDQMPNVLPTQRGLGVARKLLHELEARAHALGYEMARLDTGPKQVGARGLYECEGYIEIEDFQRQPGRGVLGREAAGVTRGAPARAARGC